MLARSRERFHDAGLGEPWRSELNPDYSLRNHTFQEGNSTMEARLDYMKASPEAYKAMVQMEGVVRRSGIDLKLLELIKIRASQLNGCAFCIDMHTKDARFKGESEQRIYALDAWRETPFYTDKERAALAWTESLTNIQIGHAPDAVYDELMQEF